MSANRVLFYTVICAGATCAAKPCRADFITRPTTSWTPITYSSANQFDYANDQQTGDGSSDIVGSVSNPPLYMQMNPGTQGSATDGMLFFRARMGEVGNGGTFNRNLFIGIDGDLDGSLDLYLGVHHQGSADELAIYSAGTDLNTSPKTTSITGPIKAYTETAINYYYSPVDTTTTDVDLDGKTDYFVSFGIPFTDIVSALAPRVTIDDTTPIRFVLATATQDNSFNQDINGLPKTYNPNATWSSLGVFSDPIAAATTATPEPGSLALMSLATLFAVGRARCRRRRSCPA